MKITRNLISLIAACFFLPSLAHAQMDRADTLNAILHDQGKSDYVMICAHRGDWRSEPENSIKAFQNCIDAGLDIIEVDLKMTKDSVLVIMHDDRVDRTTTGTGLVSEYTYTDIKQLYLKNPIEIVTRQRVPSFEEVLQISKGKILIQVDKWQPYLKQVLALGEKYDCLDQLIFRSSKGSAYVKKTFGSYLDKVHYIPVLVCKGKGDDERLDDFLNNMETCCIGVSFKKDGFPVMERFHEIPEHGRRLWFNTMWDLFSAGRDDEMAMENPDAVYGWILEQGGNVIFSDRPMFLKEYLEKKGRRTINIK